MDGNPYTRLGSPLRRAVGPSFLESLAPAEEGPQLSTWHPPPAEEGFRRKLMAERNEEALRQLGRSMALTEIPFLGMRGAAPMGRASTYRARRLPSDLSPREAVSYDRFLSRQLGPEPAMVQRPGRGLPPRPERLYDPRGVSTEDVVSGRAATRGQWQELQELRLDRPGSDNWNPHAMFRKVFQDPRVQAVRRMGHATTGLWQDVMVLDNRGIWHHTRLWF